MPARRASHRRPAGADAHPEVRSGRPRHLECANHAWTSRDGFDDFPFSKADLEIIRALRALPQPPRRRDYFA